MNSLYHPLHSKHLLFLVNVRDLTPFSLLHNNLRCTKRQSTATGKEDNKTTDDVQESCRDTCL